jgi:hypothetical protein
MALDFPNSPTNGQIFTSGIKKWQWSTAEGSWLAKNPQGAGPWKVMSTTYTAIDGDRIAANTSGGAFTITLPASPVAGNSANFADAADSWDTNNLTIARNGQTIEGLAENLVCDVDGADFTLIYNGSTWNIYA